MARKNERAILFGANPSESLAELNRLFAEGFTFELSAPLSSGATLVVVCRHEASESTK